MTAIDGNILEGVSATTLWTLHNRGTEAKRSDGVIRDPSHALRAVAFDAAASAYLTTHPRASVVALAEGPADQLLAARLDRCGRRIDLVLRGFSTGDGVA
jgi:O-methyltransferase involved in polyketide biosynthesis